MFRKIETNYGFIIDIRLPIFGVIDLYVYKGVK